jgi:outer membrane protein assembly factor BamB
MRMTRWCTIGLLITAWMVSEGGLSADDNSATWPQWRGPSRNGWVTGAPWPESLQESHLVQQWRVELGSSYSGAVVSTDKVFVTETQEEKFEAVRAFDRHTGAEIWRAQWQGAMKVASLGASMGSWIKATPTYDGESLYVSRMCDVLVCLDPETGKQRWQADFHARYGTPLPELGFVCSPLVVDQGVYVQAADSFICVNKKTGTSVWRCLIRSDLGQGSYSSPDFAEIHGQPQLLVANIPSIAGVDPATGKVLWQRVLDSYDQGCILAPIPFRGGIFTSTRASRTGYYLLKLKEGPLTPKEGHFTISVDWKNKSAIYMSSPVIIDGHVYAHLKNSHLVCIDLQNGEQKWISKRRYGKYCSMICCNDHILVLTNEGELVLIRARPDRCELVDSRMISMTETWGHLALAGNQIFIREKNAIVAYRWE